MDRSPPLILASTKEQPTDVGGKEKKRRTAPQTACVRHQTEKEEDVPAGNGGRDGVQPITTKTMTTKNVAATTAADARFHSSRDHHHQQ